MTARRGLLLAMTPLFFGGVIYAGFLLHAHHRGGAYALSTAEIRAHAVDAQTMKPIGGMLVVATWELQGMEGVKTGHLWEYETVTDSAGTFHIPAMPRRMRPFLTRLTWRDPVLRLYLPGTYARELDNAAEQWAPANSDTGKRRRDQLAVRASAWNRRTISLDRLVTVPQQARAFAWAMRFAEDMPRDRFPKTWQSLQVAYEHLPEDARRAAGLIDPARIQQR